MHLFCNIALLTSQVCAVSPNHCTSATVRKEVVQKSQDEWKMFTETIIASTTIPFSDTNPSVSIWQEFGTSIANYFQDYTEHAIFITFTMFGFNLEKRLQAIK